VFWVVVAMLGTLLVAFLVIDRFSEEGPDEPGEDGRLEDLLDP
jgi:hypothetical protein